LPCRAGTTSSPAPYHVTVVSGGDVGAVVQTAMLAGLPYTGLRDAIFTHPTMAKGLNVLFANVPAAKRQGEKS
jgi:hypothetical protein